MQEVISVALQGMRVDAERLERIGMNLANALTPGYKRETLVAQPFAAVFEQLGAGDRIAVETGIGMAPVAPFVASLDHRPGMPKATGQALDLALAGEGFFEVHTSAGPAYTRQGDFRVDARGRLVTASGHPVMGRGGEVVLTDPSPLIDAAGNVFDGGRTDAPPVAQLKLVRFERPESMARLGDGLLSSAEDPLAVRDGDAQLRQGYLESSNVTSMREMVSLIQTMRHFESMQKIATGVDEMTGTAIRKLGDLS